MGLRPPCLGQCGAWSCHLSHWPRDSYPTPIALFLNLNHGEMVRFNWGLIYCQLNGLSSSQLLSDHDTVRTRCQGLFYFIIPLYINDLAAAITLLKGNTLLYTLDKHLSSIIFVLCEKRSEPLLPCAPQRADFA